METHVFRAIVAAATVIIGHAETDGIYSSLWQAVKDSLCQVISFISTSGFYVRDYTSWPSFAIMILFLLLFVGGCSFSTSGSLKVIRVVIFFKLIKRGFLKHIHPRMVKAVMLDNKPVSAYSASSVTIHVLLYLGILMLAAYFCLSTISAWTTITSALGLFSNAGVALNGAGNFGYFGMFNQFSQLVMTFLMIAGRLEMYSIVILFTKSFWKHNKANAV
ncbi:MAG: potassium transporter TrkG [Anaerovoracaceae bacterium]